MVQLAAILGRELWKMLRQNMLDVNILTGDMVAFEDPISNEAVQIVVLCCVIRTMQSRSAKGSIRDSATCFI